MDEEWDKNFALAKLMHKMAALQLEAMLIPDDLLGAAQTGSYATAKVQEEVFRRQLGLPVATAGGGS